MGLLTSHCETRWSLLWTSRVQVKYASVAAFITEAHPANDDRRGVLRRRRGEFHMLLSAHTLPVARLVGQQGLVLDI